MSASVDNVEENSNENCGICFDDDVTVKTRGFLTSCAHVFHSSCILKWSQITNSCPICKQKFDSIRQSKEGDKQIVTEVPDATQKYEYNETDHLQSEVQPLSTDWLCTVCGSDQDEHVLLLCDGFGCDVATHTYCIGLSEVPTSSWLCNSCFSSSRTVCTESTAATVAVRRGRRQRSTPITNRRRRREELARRVGFSRRRTRQRVDDYEIPDYILNATSKPPINLELYHGISHNLQRTQRLVDANSSFSPPRQASSVLSNENPTIKPPHSSNMNDTSLIWDEMKQARVDAACQMEREKRNQLINISSRATHNAGVVTGMDVKPSLAVNILENSFSQQCKFLLKKMIKAANEDAGSDWSVKLVKTEKVKLLPDVKKFFSSLNNAQKKMVLDLGCLSACCYWLKVSPSPFSFQDSTVIEAVLNILLTLPVNKAHVQNCEGIGRTILTLLSRNDQNPACVRKAKSIIETWSWLFKAEKSKTIRFKERLNSSNSSQSSKCASKIVNSTVAARSILNSHLSTNITNKSSSCSSSSRGKGKLTERMKIRNIVIEYANAKLYPRFKARKITRTDFKQTVRNVSDLFLNEIWKLSSSVLAKGDKLSETCKNRIKLLLKIQVESLQNSSYSPFLKGSSASGHSCGT